MQQLLAKRFEPQHKEHVNAWLLERGHEKPKDFPRDGLIIFNDGAPIAAGFLRNIEGGYALLDSYASDPWQPAKLRDSALDLLTRELINLAKEKGLNQLIGYSKDVNTIERSTRHAFEILPHRVIALDLEAI